MLNGEKLPEENNDEANDEDDEKLLEYALAKIDETEVIFYIEFQATIENTQKKLNECVGENQEMNQYKEQIATLTTKLESHKGNEEFDKAILSL